MPKDKTFKVGEDVYEIPESEVKAFVADNPGAVEVNSFVKGKDTLDIPVHEVPDFLKDVPDAKPLKKKEATGPLLSSAPLASASTESLSETGSSEPSIDYMGGSNQIDLPQKPVLAPIPDQPVAENQLRAATSPVETTTKDQTNFDQSINEKFQENPYEGAMSKGLARAGNMLLKSPAMLYDIATSTVNKVVNEPLNAVTGGRVGYMPSSHDIGKQIPEEYNATGLIDESLRNDSKDFSKRYDKELNKYLFSDEKTRDIPKGLNMLGELIAEAVPVSAAIAVSAMAGATPAQITGAGAAFFGSEKMSDIDNSIDEAALKLQTGQYAPEEKKQLESMVNMPQFTKVSHAAAVGALEGFFETYGVTKVAKYMKDVIKGAGKQMTEAQVKDLAGKTFREVYAPAMKKYFGAMAEEPLSEAATQFSENVLDWSVGMNEKADFFKGVKDAAIVCFGMGGPTATAGGALEFMVTKANRQKAIQLSKERKALETDLASPDVSEPAKAAIAKKLHDMNTAEADIVASEKETMNNLPAESKQQIVELQGKAKEIADAAADPNVSEESKEILAKDLEKIDNEIDKVVEAAPELKKQKEEAEKQQLQDDKDELEYLKDVEENIGLEEDEYSRMLELEQKLASPVADNEVAEQKPAGEAQEAVSSDQGSESAITTKSSVPMVTNRQERQEKKKPGPTIDIPGKETELQKAIEQNKRQWFDEKIDYPTYRRNEDALKARLQEALSQAKGKEDAQITPTESVAIEAGIQPNKTPEGAAQSAVESQHGKPEKTTTVAAGNRIFNEPIKAIKGVAEAYFSKAFPGKTRPKFFGSKKFDRPRAKRIAAAYAEMKHDPHNPEVRAAYDAMAKETLDQYKALEKTGIQIEVNNEEPYRNSEEMIKDVSKNNRIRILGTEFGFGDKQITEEDRKNNPLLADSGVKDVNGVPLTVNDVFRAVHDLFGHGELGNSFGAKGEENAWNVHARMYSPLARRAMTSETRGQNSFVNFSGINEKVEGLVDQARKLRSEGKTEEADKIVEQIYKDLSFADQKIGLLPEEFSEIDENDIGDEDRVPKEDMAEHTTPGSSVEPKKATETKAPDKVTEKQQDLEVSAKPKNKEEGIVDQEQKAEDERKDDPDVLEQMDKDLEAMKQLSKKDLYDKKFAAMIERAWKAKNDKKISRPTYTAFRNAASDVLGGKQKYDKEELKVKVGEIFNKIKEKLLGEGYQKITLSSVSPITPKTVADLIDLASALAKRGIDAGFAIREAIQKALNSIKKRPEYKRFVKSGELDEAAFDAAVNENVTKPKAKKKKKPAPENDQPAEITGEVRKRKTVERQETGKNSKQVVENMTEDEKYYHSIKESQVKPHINTILDEVQAKGQLEQLANDMLNDENPFHEKIAYVAEFMLGDRLAALAESEGNAMQKSANIKLATKLMAHANSRVTVSATQTAMQNVVAGMLPMSSVALQGYAASAVSDIQNSHMTPAQQQDIESFAKDHLDEIMEIEEVKQKVGEATEAEINRVAEGNKGKDWVDKITSIANSLRIDISNC